MLIVSIPYLNEIQTRQWIDLAYCNQAEGIELRLDYAESLEWDAIAAIRRDCRLPLLFTLRKKSQGGMYLHEEKSRLEALSALSQFKPDYIDIEYDVPREFLERIDPEVKCICSWHCFYETPDDLAPILESMRHPAFFAYKIATLSRSIKDALRLMRFAISHNQDCQLTVIGMGEQGKYTRMLSPLIGNLMHYAAINATAATAPGQITLEAFTGFMSLNRGRSCQSYDESLSRFTR